jgi:hypothetical protein
MPSEQPDEPFGGILPEEYAQYRREPFPAYRDNPLIRALPPPLDDDGAYDYLMHQPPVRDAEFRAMPLMLREEALSDLQDIFIPLKTHTEAFNELYRLMRRGYSLRDPNDPAVARALYQVAMGNFSAGIGRSAVVGGGANGMLLWGITGAGKTSFLDRFCAYFRRHRRIFHRELMGRPSLWAQIPVVRVQCPQSASVSALGKAMLAELDRALVVTRFANTAKNLNRPELEQRVAAALSSCMVGLLIVDDLQNLRATDDDTYRLLAFLCNLMESIGVPVLLVGTYRVHSIFADDLMATSKLMSKGVFEFGRHSAHSVDWKKLVSALWSYNILTQRVDMPVDLPQWAAFHTQGVPRVLRVFMVELHRAMARGNLQKVTKPFVDEVAAKALKKFEKSLDVLRRASVDALAPDEAARWEELFPGPLKRGRNRSGAADSDFTAGVPKSQDAASPKQRRAGGAGVASTKKAAAPSADDELEALWLSFSRSDDPYQKAVELGWVSSSLQSL